MMKQRKQVVARSFGRARDINLFYFVLVLGGGAFLEVPDLVFSSQSIVPLFFYFLGSLFLALPVIYGEIIWGRWTQRSLLLSFSIFSKHAAFLGALSLVAVSLLIPSYLKKAAEFLEMGTIALNNGGEIPNGISRLVNVEIKSLALWMLGLWNCVLIILAFNSRIIKNCLMAILFFILVVWIFLLLLNFQDINSTKLLSYISWNVSELSFGLVLKSFFSPLFAGLAGLGLYQNYAAYSCLAVANNKNSDQTYWKAIGRPFALALRFSLLNILLVFFAFIVMVPFAPMLMMGTQSGMASYAVMTEWLPQIWMAQKSWLPNFNLFWMLSLALLKVSPLFLFIDFFVYQVESSVGWKRYKILLHLSLVSLGLFLLTLVPSVYENILRLVHKALWPTFTLIFCLWLSKQMPLKMQERILGRTLFLDQLATVLAFSFRYFLPLFLLLYLFY